MNRTRAASCLVSLVFFADMAWAQNKFAPARGPECTAVLITGPVVNANGRTEVYFSNRRSLQVEFVKPPLPSHQKPAIRAYVPRFAPTDPVTGPLVVVQYPPPTAFGPVKGVPTELGKFTFTGVARDPTIVSFVASPSVIEEGGASTLSWDVTTVKPNLHSPVRVDGRVTTFPSEIVNPNRTTVYELDTGSTCFSESATTEVTVLPYLTLKFDRSSIIAQPGVGGTVTATIPDKLYQVDLSCAGGDYCSASIGPHGLATSLTVYPAGFGTYLTTVNATEEVTNQTASADLQVQSKSREFFGTAGYFYYLDFHTAELPSSPPPPDACTATTDQDIASLVCPAPFDTALKISFSSDGSPNGIAETNNVSLFVVANTTPPVAPSTVGVTTYNTVVLPNQIVLGAKSWPVRNAAPEIDVSPNGDLAFISSDTDAIDGGCHRQGELVDLIHGGPPIWTGRWNAANSAQVVSVNGSSQVVEVIIGIGPGIACENQTFPITKDITLN